MLASKARFSGPLSASPTSLFSEPWKEVSHPPGQITASAPGVPQPSAPIRRHQMNWGWQICSDSQSFFIPRVAGLCSEIPLEVGPQGWSYLPVSKMDKDRE